MPRLHNCRYNHESSWEDKDSDAYEESASEPADIPISDERAISQSSDGARNFFIRETCCHRVRRTRSKLLKFLESSPVRLLITILILADIIALACESAIAENAFGKVEHEEARCLSAGLNFTALAEAERLGEEIPEEFPVVVEKTENHKLKRAETGLRAFSLTLLSVFVAEIVLTIIAVGPAYFVKPLHIFDFIIVFAALFLEIFDARGDVLGVVVVLRLLRIVQGVIDTETQAHHLTYRKYIYTKTHSNRLRRFLQAQLKANWENMGEAERETGLVLLHSTQWQLHHTRRARRMAHMMRVRAVLGEAGSDAAAAASTDAYSNSDSSKEILST